MAAVTDGDVYCVMGPGGLPNLDREMRAAGFHWSTTIIWVKDLFVLCRSKYHHRYEPIWYGWHTKGKSSFGKARDLDDVWEIPRPRISVTHPTMKPVELPARASRQQQPRGRHSVRAVLWRREHNGGRRTAEAKMLRPGDRAQVCGGDAAASLGNGLDAGTREVMPWAEKDQGVATANRQQSKLSRETPAGGH